MGFVSTNVKRRERTLQDARILYIKREVNKIDDEGK